MCATLAGGDDAGGGASSARRREDRLLRSWWRYEHSVKAALGPKRTTDRIAELFELFFGVENELATPCHCAAAGRTLGEALLLTPPEGLPVGQEDEMVLYSHRSKPFHFRDSA